MRRHRLNSADLLALARTDEQNMPPGDYRQENSASCSSDRQAISARRIGIDQVEGRGAGAAGKITSAVR